MLRNPPSQHSADDLSFLLIPEEHSPGSQNGRNSSIGFSHSSDHLYVEDSSTNGSQKRRHDGLDIERRERVSWGSGSTTGASASARTGTGKRKTMRMDGVCIDGQFIDSVTTDLINDDCPLNFADFAVQHFDAAGSDPLSLLSSEMSAIQSRKPSSVAIKKSERSNFRINLKSSEKKDDASNPFRRRMMPDVCSFRTASKPQEAGSVTKRPTSSTVAAVAVTKFCQKCGSSKLQPEFMSVENSCRKAEVWGTKNVDESSSTAEIGSRFKCFNCFFVGRPFGVGPCE